MNANLELYRIFCEVVKYKNISKAAENIYISQSAVTQSIQKLEKILGGKLFFRNKNGVELTEEGKNLYEYIGDSIEKMNNAENLFSQFIKSPVFFKVISFFKFHPLFSCKQFKIDSKSIGLCFKQYSFKIFIIEIVQQKMLIFCYDYDHSIFSNVLSRFFNEKKC